MPVARQTTGMMAFSLLRADIVNNFWSQVARLCRWLVAHYSFYRCGDNTDFVQTLSAQAMVPTILPCEKAKKEKISHVLLFLAADLKLSWKRRFLYALLHLALIQSCASSVL